MVDLIAVQNRVWANKIRQGFNVTDVQMELLLTYEELGELATAHRKGLDDLDEEVVDVIFYMLGLAKILNVDLESAIERKLTKIESRTYKKQGNAHIRIDEAKGESHE